MKKLLPRKKPSLGIVLFVLLAAVTIFVFFAGYENSTKLTQIFALATAISGVVSFLIEMIRGKKLAEAEFIVNLNQIFTSNEQYRKAYTCFENYDFENTPDIECLTNSEISNYLTFFETFYLLIERKILDIGMIDDPFAYRFFLAVHNPCVQERKLVKSPKNFPNIYILERLWMKCREKNGFPIYHEERSLEKMVPEGWNDGAYKKLYILDIEISEGADVEVGIKIVFEGGHNNWINLDNLTFWSANIPEPEPTEEDHQAAAAVDALIAALDLETLTLEDEETVIAAREAYDALTELQKTLVTKLEDLVALEAKIQDLKGVVDYPLVTLEEFNAQGGFETDDWSLATLEWKFEGGHGWVSEGWTVDGSMHYDVFKEQTSANARIYKGVKELPAGTYELSLHLAGGDLSQVKVLFGSEEFLITDYSGDYQKYSFYLEYDGSGHLYVEIAITREENGWASLDAIGIAGYDYPIESLEDFNLHGGFEPVGGDWSLAGMKWKVEGGCGWTDGNWQHEGEASYDVFRDTDATNASISKGVLLDAGNYALKLYAAGGNLSRITVEIGGEASEITCGGSFEERTISFQVDDKGPVLVKISAERAAEGWLRLDNISISVNEE